MRAGGRCSRLCSPTTESFPDNLFSGPAAVVARALHSQVPGGEAVSGARAVPLPVGALYCYIGTLDPRRVTQNTRSTKFGQKFNSVERHGHKSMTVSNRFRFGVSRRGFRGMLVRAGREEGSSMVEFGLVVPVLSMFLIGIIYGGITFYDYTILANAVSDGAATLAMGRGNNGVQGNQAPCEAAELMVQTSAYTLNQSLVSVATPTFVGQQNSTAFSSCSVTTGTNPSNGGSCTASAPCQILVSGEMGTISATYPCILTIPFAGINLCPLKGNAACGTGVSSCIGAETTIRLE